MVTFDCSSYVSFLLSLPTRGPTNPFPTNPFPTSPCPKQGLSTLLVVIQTNRVRQCMVDKTVLVTYWCKITFCLSMISLWWWNRLIKYRDSENRGPTLNRLNIYYWSLTIFVSYKVVFRFLVNFIYRNKVPVLSLSLSLIFLKSWLTFDYIFIN